MTRPDRRKTARDPQPTLETNHKAAVKHGKPLSTSNSARKRSGTLPLMFDVERAGSYPQRRAGSAANPSDLPELPCTTGGAGAQLPSPSEGGRPGGRLLIGVANTGRSDSQEPIRRALNSVRSVPCERHSRKFTATSTGAHPPRNGRLPARRTSNTANGWGKRRPMAWYRIKWRGSGRGVPEGPRRAARTVQNVDAVT